MGTFEHSDDDNHKLPLSQRIFYTLLGFIAKGFALASGAPEAYADEKKVSERERISNGMGPRFNALNDNDKCAVLYMIMVANITSPLPRNALKNELMKLAEEWAKPEALAEARLFFHGADTSRVHPKHSLAVAARSIAKGIAPRPPASAYDVGIN